MKINLRNLYQPFKTFLGSSEFRKAILVGLAVSLPVAGGIYSGYLEIGLAMAFGAFWCSPGYVIGNFPDNLRNILFATAMIVVVTLSVGFLKSFSWILFPGLFLLSFSLSYISLYGQRASMVSLSGLLALVLGFAFTPKELSIVEFALFTGIGGLWYLFLAFLWNRYSLTDTVDRLLLNTLEKSSVFLQTRASQLESPAKKKKKTKKLIRLQTELTELHESLRDHILRNYRDSGRSVKRDREVLLLIELVDLLETALANPLDKDRLPEADKAVKRMNKACSQYISSMASRLVSKAYQSPERSWKKDFEELRYLLNQSRKDMTLEVYLFYSNLLEYLKTQTLKIDKILWLYTGKSTKHMEVPDRESLMQFIPSQDYDPVLLLRNLNFRSSIFRHSLRLALTLTFGYAIGLAMDFQNPYWIMLTVIVILRPNYGMTKQRFRERLMGTVAGGIIGLLVALWLRNDLILGGLGIFSIVLAFSYLQRNYWLAATFITTGVVFIYAIIKPDVWDVVQFRVLDTVIGAGLSFLAAILLFPVWEYLEIDSCIKSSIQTKKKLLREIQAYYATKGKLPTSYKLARRDAFLANAQLRSAFIRLTQDPPSKQKDVDKISEFVVLDHSFLTALSSLGSHIRYRPTSEPSTAFNVTIEKISNLLDTMLQDLEGARDTNLCPTSADRWAELEKLAASRERREEGYGEDDWKVQEAYLVLEQLKWLQDLGQRMCTLVGKLRVTAK